MIVTNNEHVFMRITYTACMLIDGESVIAVNRIPPQGYVALSCVGRIPTSVYIEMRRVWHPAPLIVNGTIDLPRLYVPKHRWYAVYVAHRIIETNCRAPSRTFYQFGARQYVKVGTEWKLTPLTYITERVWEEVVRRAPFYHMPKLH